MRALAPLLALTLLLLGIAGAPSASAQEPPEFSTTIAGGGLPHAMRLAPVDHDAFMRRLDLPPLLDQVPALRGRAFTVSSPYWDVGVRAGDNTQPLVDMAATYYPDGGFVKTRQGGKDIWTAVDATQKAILDRYIRHSAALSETPAVFEVLRAAGISHEAIGISVGSLELTPEQRMKFWQQAQELSSTTVPVPANPAALDLSTPSAGLTWIVFNLPEGRVVSMLYSNVSGTFAELSELSQGIVFAVPRDWLVPVLGDQARSSPGNNPLAPLAVPQQDNQSAPAWWIITLGGGVAAIAAAVLLQRRLTHA